MFDLSPYEPRLLALHDHICPRQVLGLRMGELAGRLMHLDFPQAGKRALALVETDGCFADGVMVATGCSIGHRTLRLIDHGKVAVTFVDMQSDPTIGWRIWPHPEARRRALAACPDQRSRWHAQLAAYQRMRDEELLCAARVELLISARGLVSRPHVRVTCAQCGEEIVNERERIVNGRVLCRHCAGESYFSSLHDYVWRAAEAVNAAACANL
ncbi:MAG: TraR/DksA C4-type zinc finger protein [Anaerolineae bacterium]|jgi:formylmethanofuran dehydrogenase subunit E|nr:TraR/DksA C4-type zinc finger protein [Anaerolineae bacterium]